MKSEYCNTCRHLSDEEIARFLALHRLRRANYATEMDPEYMAESVAFLDTLIADLTKELALRRRAGLVPAPPRFDAAFVADLKARIDLGELCEHELGARLDRVARGQRRGPCPICKAGERSFSNPFVVFVAPPDDQHYYCHACQARGDAVSAIMQAYGDTFPQAIERLCEHGHVPLPGTITPLHRVQRPPDYLRLAR